MSELKINSKDALTTFGVRMGEGFIDAIFAPAPLKEFAENKSRLEHGKTVIYAEPRLDERDVTLVFHLEGSNEADYLAKYKLFNAELKKGLMEIDVPILGETYRLTYKNSMGFGMNTARTFSKITVKFNEPNPSLRSE